MSFLWIAELIFNHPTTVPENYFISVLHGAEQNDAHLCLANWSTTVRLNAAQKSHHHPPTSTHRLWLSGSNCCSAHPSIYRVFLNNDNEKCSCLCLSWLTQTDFDVATNSLMWTGHRTVYQKIKVEYTLFSLSSHPATHTPLPFIMTYLIWLPEWIFFEF